MGALAGADFRLRRWLDAGALFLFQRDGAFDEIESDDPDEWKKQDAQEEPRKGEPKHSLRHQFRREIIQQRQSEESEEENRSAGDGKSKLLAHEAIQKGLAMNSLFIRTVGDRHAKFLVKLRELEKKKRIYSKLIELTLGACRLCG